MNWEAKFWISLIGNLVLAVLLFFKTGLNSLVVDYFKRKRDKEDREQKSLKRLKYVLERFDRNNTLLVIEICTKGLNHVSTEQGKADLEKSTSISKELEEVLIEVPSNISRKVEEIKEEQKKVMGDIAMKESKGGSITKESLKAYVAQLEEKYKNAIKAIEKLVVR